MTVTVAGIKISPLMNRKIWRPWLTVMAFFAFILSSGGQTVQQYTIPDSLKAVQFLAEFSVISVKNKKEASVGIKTDIVTLSIDADKKEKEISFEFLQNSKVITTGTSVENDNDELEWKYNWGLTEKYKLLLSIAQDSADNFLLYSGYAFLPKENKWKLIGTCKVEGRWSSIQQPAAFYTTGKKNAVNAIFSQVWIQRSNGSWKNLLENNLPNPVISLASHIDSITRHNEEIAIIKDAIEKGLTDAAKNKDDIFYNILSPGNGQQINTSDTVTVYYKGTLFGTNEVFDQTKDKPATFPLNRLIKGWQIGVSLCKVGSKIKLVIPSALAYSIRTRSPKIPPNSILEFEVEILDAKKTK